MKFLLAVAALAVAAVVAGAALAASDTPLPVVRVASTGKAVTVSGSTVSGAVKFVFSHSNKGEADPVVVRLKDGVTLDQFNEAVAKVSQDATPILKVADFVTGGFLISPASMRVSTVLTPGNYVALDSAAGKPASFPRTPFTVTQAATPATRPKPTSTFAMHDFRFSGPASVARKGTMRYSNKSKSLHFVIALKVPKGYTTKQIIGYLRSGTHGKVLQKAETVGLLGIVGPDTSNDIQYSLSAGHWVIACFNSTPSSKGKEHTMRGMERGFVVK